MTPRWNHRTRPPPLGSAGEEHSPGQVHVPGSAGVGLSWPDTHVDAGLLAFWCCDAEPEMFVSFVHSFIPRSTSIGRGRACAGCWDDRRANWRLSPAERAVMAEGGELWSG